MQFLKTLFKMLGKKKPGGKTPGLNMLWLISLVMAFILPY